jgi:putative MFS transporter
MLLTGSSGVIAVLAPYAAEAYPTAIRGVGSGLAAACSKAGGMFGPPAIAALLQTLPEVWVVETLVAIPMALATIAIARHGVETRGRHLDDLQPPQTAQSSGTYSTLRGAVTHRVWHGGDAQDPPG